MRAPERTEIVTDVDNFPTDRYVLEGLARARGLRSAGWRRPGRRPAPEQVAALSRNATALVTFSHVSYRSAQIAEMAEITALAHEAGALMLWDLSHSAGAVPVALDADGADLAVGCTYKYLYGGPGAPAFMYVRDDLQEQLRQPIWGWLGRRDPFAMGPGYSRGRRRSRAAVGHAAGARAAGGRRGRAARGRGRDRRDPRRRGSP